ncbi:hypothetical protein ACS0TY_014856 [Phlomoides rotata]
MANIRAKGKKKNVGILNLKMVVERLQKSLLNSGKKHYSGNDEEETRVPEDVKEGHFAVVAVAEEANEFKRFIVPLNYLTHPSFLRLLEQAAEVYGFDHDGAVTVPCCPTVLERLLAEQ